MNKLKISGNYWKTKNIIPSPAAYIWKERRAVGRSVWLFYYIFNCLVGFLSFVFWLSLSLDVLYVFVVPFCLIFFTLICCLWEWLCVCFIKRYCWVVVLPPPSNHIKAVVMLCFVPSTLPSWKRCVDLCFISRNYCCGLSLTFVRMKTIFYFWGFL